MMSAFPVMFSCLCVCVVQAFVEVCMKHNNTFEAKKYVSRVTAEQKVKSHLAVG